MQLRPLDDRLIVQQIARKEEVTSSGIILPETVGDKSSEQSVVIAIGPGRLLENGQRAPMSAKVGDKVVFQSNKAEKIKIEEKEYLVLSESDVMPIIE